MLKKYSHIFHMFKIIVKKIKFPSEIFLIHPHQKDKKIHMSEMIMKIHPFRMFIHQRVHVHHKYRYIAKQK